MMKVAVMHLLCAYFAVDVTHYIITNYNSQPSMLLSLSTHAINIC